MRSTFFLVCIVLYAFLTSSVMADENRGLSLGQDVYVPAYSHIYSGNNDWPFLLTVTVSIRNIDPNHAITIEFVDYYETQGKLLKHFLDKPVTLKAMESIRYIIPEKDKDGGSGANFIVRWKADTMVNPPVMESIMIGTRSQQGISFTSRGQEILKSN